MLARPQFDKVNEICEQLTLVSDIFAAIVQEVPSALRLDACATILFMSQLALDNLKKAYIERLTTGIPLALQILSE